MAGRPRASLHLRLIPGDGERGVETSQVGPIRALITTTLGSRTKRVSA
jgi:hypothetical protein